MNKDEMQKIKIRENLYQYYFIEDDGVSPDSIFVCINRETKKALIIDTAYEEFSEKVKKDLAVDGIEPEIVVLSHYHPDHTAGAVVFQGRPLYANQYYADNYDNCQIWKPGLTFVRPTHLIKDGDSLTFGTFHIKFIYAPGHSQCMVLSLINDDVLHVGDLLMFDRDDRPTLPYVSTGGGFKQHIDSLERLKTIAYNTMVVPHGHLLNDKDKITENIDDRIYYLKRVLSSNGTLPLAACLKNDISRYANSESFHDTNLIQLMAE